MLKDEILEVLELFEKYQIPEEQQRELFAHGLHFDFTYGDPDYNGRNQHLTVFGVGILLKTCLETKRRLNVKKLLKAPYMFQDENFIKEIADAQEPSHDTIRTLGKKRSSNNNKR